MTLPATDVCACRRRSVPCYTDLSSCYPHFTSSWETGLQHVFTAWYIHGSTALVGQSFLFIGVPLYTTLLWTSDQPVAEAATNITCNRHNRRTCIASMRFEPASPVSENPQTHALDRAATGIGLCKVYCQLAALLVLLVLRVSIADCSHLQGDTRVEDMHSCPT